MQTTALGKVIRRVRLSKNLTQKELSERSSVSTIAISHIEQNGENARIGTIRKLARGLDLEMAQLFIEEGGAEEAAA